MGSTVVLSDLKLKQKKVRKVFTSNSINPVDLPIYLVE